MKENVIIGKLIPAGTGMKIYRNIKLDSDVNDDDTLDFADDDFADFAEEEAVGAVSYTHLDVYKRQTMTLRVPAWDQTCSVRPFRF